MADKNFNDKVIRYAKQDGGTYLFSVVDVMAALVAPKIPRQYWNDLKRKNTVISQLSEKCRQLKLIAADGKAYKTDAKRGSRYGYRLEYEGNAPDGTPYAKTASVLNSGTSTIKPRRFITKAVRKLKGLDDRAAKRWEEKINDEFTE